MMSDELKPIENGDPIDLEYLEALEETLSEWNSDNDDRAYAELWRAYDLSGFIEPGD